MCCWQEPPRSAPKQEKNGPHAQQVKKDSPVKQPRTPESTPEPATQPSPEAQSPTEEPPVTTVEETPADTKHPSEEEETTEVVDGTPVTEEPVEDEPLPVACDEEDSPTTEEPVPEPSDDGIPATGEYILALGKVYLLRVSMY